MGADVFAAKAPELLTAGEAVSALDVSVQAQVLQLLDEIRDRMNLAMLFITHDLRVAAQVCDRVAVMSKGGWSNTARRVMCSARPSMNTHRPCLLRCGGAIALSETNQKLTKSVGGKGFQAPRAIKRQPSAIRFSRLP